MPTSARSKGSSKKKVDEKAIDRPFAPGILRRAKTIAAGYQIIIHQEDGLYFGRGLELTGAMEDGRTPDECVRKTRDVLTTAVAYLLENGETPPAPASENKRTEQVNVRLTAEEKLLLEEAARSKGYRGVSDFVRSASLASAK
jgi:predicted RNase H-like HicB family nuclease